MSKDLDEYIIKIVSKNIIGTRKKDGSGYNIITAIQINIQDKNNNFFNFNDDIINYIIRVNDIIYNNIKF